MPRSVYELAFTLITVFAFLSPGNALAVPVTDFVSVQPIDVCSGAAGTTTGCAPINNKSQNYQTAAVGAIGFTDAATGINITNAIWNQAGIDVTFLPAVQYPNAGSFLTVSVTNCSSDGSDCSSSQFQTLSDQASISMRDQPNPAPPLSANPTTINMFFITKLSPPASQPGTLYGLAWVGNNGVAIASNALLGLGSRVDTLAHEVGHDLDLDHTTFGAGAANNLETAGNSRTTPTSTSNALAQLAAGTADQLVAEQLNQVLLSGLINPIPNIVTQVTDPTGHGDFSVSFENEGRPNEALKTLTLTAPAGAYLEYGTFDQLDLPGDTSGITATPTYSDCMKFGRTKACQSLELAFTGTPFELNDIFDYTVAVCQLQQDKYWINESGDFNSPGDGGSRCKTVPLKDLVDALDNGTYTYQFSDGFQTTSVLSGNPVLSANSWDPDPSIPTQIYNQTLLYDADIGKPPCTPTDGACPGLDLEDASPIDEGTLVPEPASGLILAAGLFALSAAGRGRAKTSPAAIRNRPS